MCLEGPRFTPTWATVYGHRPLKLFQLSISLPTYKFTKFKFYANRNFWVRNKIPLQSVNNVSSLACSKETIVNNLPRVTLQLISTTCCSVSNTCDNRGFHVPSEGISMLFRKYCKQGFSYEGNAIVVGGSFACSGTSPCHGRIVVNVSET